MEDWSTIFSAPNLTLGSIVGGFVISIALGWLIPRKTYRDRMDDLKDQVEDARSQRDQWREAYLAAEEGRVVAAQQNDEMLDGLETVKSVLMSIPRGSDHVGR